MCFYLLILSYFIYIRNQKHYLYWKCWSWCYPTCQLQVTQTKLIKTTWHRKRGASIQTQNKRLLLAATVSGLKLRHGTRIGPSYKGGRFVAARVSHERARFDLLSWRAQKKNWLEPKYWRGLFGKSCFIPVLPVFCPTSRVHINQFHLSQLHQTVHQYNEGKGTAWLKVMGKPSSKWPKPAMTSGELRAAGNGLKWE